MKQILKRHRKAYTMLEMMGVALLLGTLATALAISYTRIADNAKHRALEDRFAATAMAILLYEVDHNDQPPTSLSDLLETSFSGQPYLPEVPKDPFRERQSGGDQSLRWDRSTRLLRSTGKDGLWNTGDDVCYQVEFNGSKVVNCP